MFQEEVREKWEKYKLNTKTLMKRWLGKVKSEQTKFRRRYQPNIKGIKSFSREKLKDK